VERPFDTLLGMAEGQGEERMVGVAALSQVSYSVAGDVRSTGGSPFGSFT